VRIRPVRTVGAVAERVPFPKRFRGAAHPAILAAGAGVGVVLLLVALATTSHAPPPADPEAPVAPEASAAALGAAA
jgi:hypothetical protein